LDVISLAMRGALKTLRLPKVSAVKSALLESLDFNVEDDPCDPLYLDISDIPVKLLFFLLIILVQKNFFL
jgi:hypothetical protein